MGRGLQSDRIIVYRVLLLCAAVAISIFGIYHFINQSETTTLLLIRAIIVFTCSLIFILSFYLPRIRESLYLTAYFMGFFIILWLEYLTYLNDFNNFYGRSLLVAITGVSFVFRKKNHLRIFLVVVFLASVANMSISSTQTLDYTFLLHQAIMSAILWVVMGMIINTNRRFRLRTAEFRSLFNAYDASFMVVDSNYNIVEINDACRHTFHLSTSHALQGMPVGDLFYKENARELIQALQQVRKDEPIYTENEVQLRNGKKFWCSFRFFKTSLDDPEETRILISMRDISERKENERQLISSRKQLAASESQLNAILNGVSMGIWAFDKNFKIIRFNTYHAEMIKRMTGKQIKVGDNVFDFIPPDAVEYSKKLYKRLFEGEMIQTEREFTLLNGEKSWGYFQMSPLIIEGEIAGGSIIAKDITDRKQAEFELQASEERYKLLAESMTDAISLHDLNGKTLYASPSYERLYGYTLEEFKSVRNFSLVHPEDRPKVNQVIDDFQSGKIKEARITYRAHHKEGYYIWVESDAKLLNDAQHDEPRILLAARDITERQKAQQAIIESELKLKGIFQMAPISILLADLDGKFLDVNQAFCKTFGYKLEEVLGKDTDVISHPDDVVPYLDVNAFLVESSHTVFEKEKRFIHRDGRIINGILKISLIRDKDSKPLLYLGQIVDISDMKHTEALLKQKNTDLEKVNAELDRFVYSAAHDLRAPLSSILGLVEIANKDQNPNYTPTYFHLIEKSVIKLDGFIKDIIDFSRNARVDIQVQVVDFEQLIQNAFENFNYLKNSELLIRKIDLRQTAAFRSDVKRLRILFNNLISNAIRYLDEEKSKNELHISIEVSSQRALIKFADNGVGIEAEHQKRIFEMFYRASEKPQGSGLGLYIVKEVIDKLNGKISVQSDYGVGTTFFMELPNVPVSEGKKAKVKA